MAESTVQEATKDAATTGTTKFGFGQLNNPTPKWVTWVFRTEFLLNKFLLFVLGASTLFTPTQVKESLIWIAAIDATVWGLGRFVGIEKSEIEDIQKTQINA